MLNKFQDKAQKIIALSESIAFEMGHNEVGNKHLLLSFLKNKDNKLKTMLEKEGVTYEIVKEEIVSIFGKKNSKPFYMEYTNSFKKTLENSILFSKKKGEDKVSSESLAICMLENSESVAKELLVNKTENLQNIIEELKKL